MVGTGGFEPPTPRTPSVCATRLRHVPTGGDVYYSKASNSSKPELFIKNADNFLITAISGKMDYFF
jgi:hypothetical protein